MMKSLIGQALKGQQYYYTLEREIAHSRYYTVYLAKFGQHRLAAIKTLKEVSLNSPEIINQFNHEIQALQSLNHPYIVQFYEVIYLENIPYLVMEYLEGITLEDWLNTQEIKEDFAIHIIRQLGEALIYLHQLSILHLDVSPQNIIISSDGQKATLIDFSNATDLKEYSSQTSVPIALETVNTNVPVTPGYAPIEQHLSRDKIGKYSEVYSLAATFYYMVTKTHPISALKRKGIVGKGETLVSAKKLNPQLSRKSYHALHKGLEIEPKKRTKTVQEWLNLLGSSTQKKKRNYQGLLSIFLGSLIFASGLSYWFYQRNHPPQELAFSLAGNQLNNQYLVNQGEAIQIINGRVCDQNKHTDLRKIQLTLSQETPIKVFNIQQFKIQANDKYCLSFDYTFTEKLGANLYTLTGVAYDEANIVSEPFSIDLIINTPPEGLQLSKGLTTNTDYEADQPIIIEGQISDQNGWQDLAKIHFWLVNAETKKEESLNDLSSTELTSSEDNTNQVTFRYNLKGVSAGNYQIKAQGIDKNNQKSAIETLNFKVNAEPQNFEFKIEQSSPDIIKINGTVSDQNPDDIRSIFLTLYQDEQKQQTFTLNRLTTTTSQKNLYQFNLSLKPLPPGNYKLEGQAQDKSGQSSNTFTTVFVIENPSSETNESEQKDSTDTPTQEDNKGRIW